ncbi:MAG: cyclic pyranopterin monophosphate synthase MoaC [Candidatus Hydrogenedentes bacterium]|nr:cyclic pyranopterin monophosphate synthase MoaC [Candidatus Hydrogenedentota bacterium]
MLSHVNSDNQPAMVDVSGKTPTKRSAHARAMVSVPEQVAALFADGDLRSKKGPVFQTAILAGVMAAKKTSDLIPLCHPIGLEDCKIYIQLEDNGEIQIDCHAVVTHKTGVEMEALTGAMVAALTVYDMCKGISHDIVIRETRLIEKRGGKSDYHAPK